ncbi:hypothetical protein [Fodinicola feengrottensis]
MPSRPAPADWSKLTIWQAATDQHVIVQALKRIYKARWLSTGGSKGGMTATYHRRFYPNDVYATIPYVAPNDVIDPVDSYGQFIAHDGTDPVCRANLNRIQRESLQRRNELEAIAQSNATQTGGTFTLVGTLDHAVELAVVDSIFAFWQYGSPSDCATIPPAGAPAQQIYDWYEGVESLLTYTDQGIEPYVPYYYQAGTQLGSPLADESYLKDPTALSRHRRAPVVRTEVDQDALRLHGDARRGHVGALPGTAAALHLRRIRPVERGAVPARAGQPRLVRLLRPQGQPRLEDRDAAGRAGRRRDRDDPALGRHHTVATVAQGERSPVCRLRPDAQPAPAAVGALLSHLTRCGASQAVVGVL